MKRALIIYLLIVLPFWAWGERKKHGNTQAVLRIERAPGNEEVDVEDSQDNHQRQVDAITAFLQQTKSPLAVLAGDFVSVGDIYNLDPYLLVAISGVESSFGKNYPRTTNNPFGIYSSSNTLRYFGSFSEALDYLGKLLSEKYDTTSVENIGRKYCPPSGGCDTEKWIWVVEKFIEEIKGEEVKNEK